MGGFQEMVQGVACATSRGGAGGLGVYGSLLNHKVDDGDHRKVFGDVINLPRVCFDREYEDDMYPKHLEDGYL